MDESASRKRKRTEPLATQPASLLSSRDDAAANDEPEESTDFKLALLSSLHPALDGVTLLEALLASNGSVEHALASLPLYATPSPAQTSRRAAGLQSSLNAYRMATAHCTPRKKPMIKKGKTLHLYAPEDIENQTPCSLIPNFLPAKQADALLVQLLDEARTYQSLEFKLFDNVVRSPHTSCFYVHTLEDAAEQRAQYMYDGRKVEASITVAIWPKLKTLTNCQGCPTQHVGDAQSLSIDPRSRES